MIEKLVDKIIDKQLEENVISKEDVNIYRYGYILVCDKNHGTSVKRFEFGVLYKIGRIFAKNGIK